MRIARPIWLSLTVLLALVLGASSAFAQASCPKTGRFKVKIDSAPGQGTRVRLEVPLPRGA